MSTVRLAMPSDAPSAMPNAAPETRTLPSNIAAEAAFLGAILIDNKIAETLPVRLEPVHFHEPIHGRIFGQVEQLMERGLVVSPVTLKPYFEADEAMRALGGPAYLAQLTGQGAGLIGARQMAQQIYDLALLRELIEVGRTLVDQAMDTSEAVDPKAQIEAAETALYRVSGGEAELGSVKSFAQATHSALVMAEKALGSSGVSGLTTGLNSLNAKIGGMTPSDLLIVAGRPGMGKSSLATNIGFAAADRWLREEADGIDPAKRIGAKVAFFSLEMSADQLATRILAEQAGVSGEALRMGKISKDEFHELARASARLQTLPFFIDDTPALTIAALRTRARRLQRRHGVNFIIVDYLQLLSGGSKGSDNRVQEISEISRGLKTLAKELDVPVMALSQLSRAVEQREDKRPMLSDLRESGSIEQDADMVWFVYREDYYVAAREPKRPSDGDDAKTFDAHNTWAQEMERVHGLAELIIAKHRHGSTGKVRLHFEGRTTKFSDLADDAQRIDDYD